MSVKHLLSPSTMPVYPGSMVYDPHDNSSTIPLTEADKIRFHFRDRCNVVLNRLFPEHGQGAMGDWNHKDALELTALFELARVTRHAEAETPLLTRHTILRVLTKLSTCAPFYDFGETSLIDLERCLRLLAAALRLYKYEGTSLKHDLRDSLYKGINTLSDLFGDNQKNHKDIENMQIEQESIAFLLKHCQYLLISIDDADSLSKIGARKVGKLFDGALAGYGNQYIDARKLGREAVSRQRLRPKWHDEYMRLEDICFTIYARAVGIEVTPATAAELTELMNEEQLAIHEIRDSMEDQLTEGPSKLYGVSKSVSKLWGKTTQSLKRRAPSRNIWSISSMGYWI